VSRFGRWSRSTSLAALLVLVALVLVPDGFAWRGPAAAALVSLALAGLVLAGGWSIATLSRASRTES
jgi:hypothetical protein